MRLFGKIFVGAVECILVPFWLCNCLLELAQRSCSTTASNYIPSQPLLVAIQNNLFRIQPRLF